MSYDTRIGLAGLLMAFLGIAMPYLFPDKKLIGWICLLFSAVLCTAWIAVEVKKLLGTTKISLALTLTGGALIGAVAAGIIWYSIPAKKQTNAAVTSAANKHLVTLMELFENDWPNLPGYYTDGVIQIHSRARNKTLVTVNLSWRLNGDFVSRSTFLAFFMEQAIPATEAFSACLAIADSYGQFINDVNTRISMWGKSPDDTSPTYLKDMAFSKRIFIYYENPEFSLEQKGIVESVYKRNGLSIQFRGAAYAWSHREDHPPLRPNRLAPNSVVLPEARLYPGLKIEVINIGH